MVLAATGELSFLDIQNEFGGTNPIGMDEYYSNGAYATSISGIPISGNEISFAVFRGKSKKVLIPITTSTAYYSSLTRVNGSSFAIIQAGIDPDVQLQMNSVSYNSQVTHVYAQHRLQDFSSVEINFEIYITTSSVADAIWFYMGQSLIPDSSRMEGDTGTGYQLIFEVYNSNTTIPRGINLFKNGSASALNYSTTSHIADAWLPVKIIYNKSATNTWAVYFNGINIINYSDPNHSTWLSNSGRFWGFGSRTGGATGSFYIRRVNVNVTPPMLLQYTKAEAISWVAPLTGNIRVLVVAGGGGAGGAIAGGGGGGGVVYNSALAVNKESAYALTVGAGGTAGGYASAPAPGNGGSSIFGSITAIGGGAGGMYGFVGGASGGSGGGGAGNATTSTITSGGAGTAGQGNAGGAGYVYGSGSFAVAAGGGGAGGVGANATAAPGGAGGAGGAGVANSITGVTVYYGGGGGGGARYAAGGQGGQGGGGNGASGSSGTTISNAVAGTNGLGGGAGGGANEASGQPGGSGVIIIAYP